MGRSDRVGATVQWRREGDLGATARDQKHGDSGSTGVFPAQCQRPQDPPRQPTTAKDTWTRRISAHPQAAPRPTTLSHRFWGLDWSNHLPRVVARNGGAVHLGNWNQVSDFIERMQPGLREVNHDKRRLAAQSSKQRYFREDCDLLDIRWAGKTIGVFIGAPEDWSTYYCRLIAVDPEHNRPHFIRSFAKEALFPILAEAGVERLVGETNPTNLVMQRLFIDLGFHPTGQHLTDRWGTMIRFTRFLNDDAASSFARRYAPGA